MTIPNVRSFYLAHNRLGNGKEMYIEHYFAETSTFFCFDVSANGKIVP